MANLVLSLLVSMCQNICRSAVWRVEGREESLASRAANDPSRSMKIEVAVKLGHHCKDHKGQTGWFADVLKAARPL